MSNEALNAVWKQARVTGTARVALLALADAANQDFQAWLRQREWAAMAGCSREYLNRHVIPALVQAGEVRKVALRERGRSVKLADKGESGTRVIVWQLRRPGEAPFAVETGDAPRPGCEPVVTSAAVDKKICAHAEGHKGCEHVVTRVVNTEVTTGSLTEPKLNPQRARARPPDTPPRVAVPGSAVPNRPRPRVEPPQGAPRGAMAPPPDPFRLRVAPDIPAAAVAFAEAAMRRVRAHVGEMAFRDHIAGLLLVEAHRRAEGDDWPGGAYVLEAATRRDFAVIEGRYRDIVRACFAPARGVVAAPRQRSDAIEGEIFGQAKGAGP